MDQIRQFLNGITALIASATLFLIGITALVVEIKRTQGTLDPNGNFTNAVRAALRRRSPRLIVGVALLVLAAGLVSAYLSVHAARSVNEQLRDDSWAALNTKDWPTAIARASKCVDQFGAQAEREQQKLTADHIPLPPTGKVSPEERDGIWARGVLNDVAACYFIKGQAAQELYRCGEAKAAYQAAAGLPHARVWDPAGFFWSPAEAAEARLTRLQCRLIHREELEGFHARNSAHDRVPRRLALHRRVVVSADRKAHAA